ncbi:MAG: TolC family outer membrane protein [Pseudomonadota bacterium]|nr:TolC family outer membrane protein [Pseudomonadota bacterium]
MTKLPVLFFSLMLGCQAAHAADLLDIYRRVEEREPKLAAARAGLEAAGYQRAQSRAAMLPQVALLAGTSWDVGRSHPDNLGTSHHNAGYALVLKQSLWSRPNAIDYQRGQLGEAAAQIGHARVRQDLMLKVARAYFDVLLAQDSVHSSRVQYLAAVAQQNTAERFLQQGTNTRTDTQEAEARRDASQARQLVAENVVESKREALRRLLGDVPPPLARLGRDAVAQLPQPADIDRWAEAAETGNLDVLAAGIAVELASRLADKAQAGGMPALDLIVARGQFGQNGGIIFGLNVPDNTVRQTSVGLQLSVPIYTGGALKARMGETAALLEKSRQELLDTRRNAAMLARQAYLDIVSGLAQIAALQIALRSGNATLSANKLAFAAGTRVSSDVLNAEQQVASTEWQLAQVRYDMLLGQLSLKAATGTLDIADFQAVNAGLVDNAAP